MFEINQTMRVNPDPGHPRRPPPKRERAKSAESEADEGTGAKTEGTPPDSDKGIRLDIRI